MKTHMQHREKITGARHDELPRGSALTAEAETSSDGASRCALHLSQLQQLSIRLDRFIGQKDVRFLC